MRVPAHVRIFVVAAISILALIALVIRENQARAAGREVIMTMQAVDPRDALTGHYVEVSLNETVAPGGFCPADDPKAQGWLALAPSGGRWHVVGRAESRAVAQKLGAVVVRGKARCSSGWMADDRKMIFADLGVSRFHIAQAEAERIDKMLREQRTPPPPPPPSTSTGPTVQFSDGATPPAAKAAAILSIGKDGKARLKGVEVEGRRLMLSLY